MVRERERSAVMFVLYADKNRLTVRQRELLTSGSAGSCRVRFQFSPEWEGMERPAVFKTVGRPVCVRLDAGGECLIPWEVLVRPGRTLLAGAYGTRGESVTLPTVWAGLGVVLEGAAPGEDARPPTPDLWRQALDGHGDGLSLDGEELSLTSGERTLATVRLGAGDHRRLSGLDGPDQHPIQAICGLDRELARRVAADDALSPADIIRIMGE